MITVADGELPESCACYLAVAARHKPEVAILCREDDYVSHSNNAEASVGGRDGELPSFGRSSVNGLANVARGVGPPRVGLIAIQVHRVRSPQETEEPKWLRLPPRRQRNSPTERRRPWPET